MRGLTLLCLQAFLCPILRAQYVYTIKADSVRITNCDSAELILENHTQGVPGFLFNTGNGRTIFKRGVQKLNDTFFVIGADTLTLPNAWVQGGNSFVDTGILGTRDNYPLDLYSNGTQRLRLTTAGNLLIGTNLEYGTYKTQIAGPSQWSTGSGQVIITPNMSTPSDIGLGSTAPFGWLVGNPNIRLGVDGTVSVLAPGLLFGNTGGPYNASALVTTISNVNEWNYADGYPNGQNYYYFGTVLQTAYSGYKRPPLRISADQLQFLSGASESEAARFGPITAKKLTLAGDVNWPDYVFDSSYRLPALDDVDIYIQKEHHLPGIPAAAEIQSQGLDVGAGQAALLKKIEELTLYDIGQKKTIDEQNRRLDTLEKQLAFMKAEIEELKKLETQKPCLQ